MSPSSCSTTADDALAAEVMQRSRGAIRVGVRGGALRSLSQSGCLRACFPRRHGGPVEAVIVNTAGGIADGDELRIDAEAQDGASLIVTTPSAERIYRARPGAAPAQMRVQIRVGHGAHVAFLPQETILFEGCALDRTLDVEMESGSSFLGVEALVFGRQESGETIGTMHLHDRWRLRRDGQLILHDSTRLQGSVAGILASRAGAGGRRGVATVVYAAADAGSMLDRVRQVLIGNGGASAWDGMLLARILAPDGMALRAATSAILTILNGRSLPRIWV